MVKSLCFHQTVNKIRRNVVCEYKTLILSLIFQSRSRIFLSPPHNTAHCITVKSSKRCKFRKKLVSNSSLTAADVFPRSNNTLSLSLSYFQCPVACGPVIRSSLRPGPQGDTVTVSVTVSVTTKFLCQCGVSVVSGTNVQHLNFSYSSLKSSVKKMQ